MTGDLTVPSLNGGQLAGFRNQIINGGFGIWQRGASFSVSQGVSFTSDRWACNAPQGSTTTATISVVAPVAAGFTYAIKNTGSNFMALQQGVELARDASNMQFYVGSQWTLSFWSDEDQTSNSANVKFKNGLKDQGADAIPVSSSFPNFQSTGETANGYTRYSASFTITADASTVANADCLAVILSVGAGQSATGVQLEPGPVATPFEQRPVGLELALCQRYYQSIVYSEGTGFLYLYQHNTIQRSVSGFFPVCMRTDPTFTATISYSEGAGGFFVLATPQTYYVKTDLTSATATSSYVSSMTADAEV